MICEFSLPLNYAGVAPLEGEPFAFSSVDCEDLTIEPVAGRGEFFISKKIGYGEIIIITFLLIFFILFTTKIMWNFVKQDFNEKL